MNSAAVFIDFFLISMGLLALFGLLGLIIDQLRIIKRLRAQARIRRRKAQIA